MLQKVHLDLTILLQRKQECISLQSSRFTGDKTLDGHAYPSTALGSLQVCDRFTPLALCITALTHKANGHFSQGLLP